MEIAQNSDDEMTSDLLLGIYTELEKHAWMLRVLESIIDFKAEVTCSEQEGIELLTKRRFCLTGRREMTDCSSHRSWISLKAEAARSEQEGVGTPDYEALLPRMKA